MAETQNEQQPHSFKRKLGNTTYTVKVHFSKDTDKTFKDRVQKLIINECLEKIRNNPRQHFTPFIRADRREGHVSRQSEMLHFRKRETCRDA